MNETQKLWNPKHQRYEVHGLTNSGLPDMSSRYATSHLPIANYGVKEASEHIDALVENSKNGDYPLKKSDLCIIQVNTESSIVSIGHTDEG